ncbi:hypothetical protein [Pseudomonas rhizosphaerae]|uniref:hypothetical protein n=1 Tax=Pseudomonas rhizosphaerae TaxID=216142 RepID=UPI002B4667A6|nr:hypothetical protein [Pseudomonas rhizosphaerae]MEB2870350.1 hypothetical protein [Pseudomonas rhizosphaerae]
MDSSRSEFYGSLLDQAGKLVVGSGVVLALAYVAGWVYSWHLYDSLHSSWVMKFIEPQGFIKEGLPWAMYCTAVAALVFFAFGNSDSMKGFANGWMFLIGTVVTVLTSVCQAFGVNLEEYSLFNSILAFFLSLYAASALALSLRMLEEKQAGLRILVVSTLGLFAIAVLFPFIQAYEASRDLRVETIDKPLVIDDSDGVQGILVSAIGTKYLVLVCKTQYQLSMMEPSSSLKIQPSKADCE